MASTTPVAKAGDVKDMVRELFETKKYSDMGIYCRGKFWDVHQSVVCMRSEVFESFCVKAGRQSQGKLHIDLSDYESEIISSVLEYAYLDQYEYAGEDGMVFHLNMYIAACKFNMVGLQQMAIMKYQSTVHGSFKEGEWERSFCQAAELLWTQLKDEEGKDLKAVVVSVAQEKIRMLLGSGGGEFRKLGLEIPEIGMAVLEAVVDAKKKEDLIVEHASDATEVLEETPGSSVLSPDIEVKVVETTEVSPPAQATAEWMNWGSKRRVSDPQEIIPEVPEIEVSWGFSVAKKTKKNTAEAVDEPTMVETVQEPIVEPAPPEDDGWGMFGTTSKKSKKDKKKTYPRVEFDEEIAMPAIEEEWGTARSKEREVVIEKTLQEPEPEIVIENDAWGFPGPKKDKKKKKKISSEYVFQF